MYERKFEDGMEYQDDSIYETEVAGGLMFEALHVIGPVYAIRSLSGEKKKNLKIIDICVDRNRVNVEYVDKKNVLMSSLSP